FSGTLREGGSASWRVEEQASSMRSAERKDWIDDLDELGGEEDGARTTEDLDVLEGEEDGARERRERSCKPANAEAGTVPASATTSVLDKFCGCGWMGGMWPDDVLFAVMCAVGQSLQALCAARVVSGRWRDAASSNVLWKRLWDSHHRCVGAW
ncbi:MAG: hypothetical protein SGPRY_000142, partial [Prymnesium sp.]